MPPSPVVIDITSRRALRTPRPRPAKCLRADVRISVQQSIQRLPQLAQRNPEGALLIGELIIEWDTAVPTDGPAREAAFDQQRQAGIEANRRNGSRRVAAWLAAHPHAMAVAWLLGVLVPA